MTQSSTRPPATGGCTAILPLGQRLILPVLVFAGTMAAYHFATHTNACQICPPKPLASALPWAAGAALFVLIVQTRLAGRKNT